MTEIRIDDKFANIKFDCVPINIPDVTVPADMAAPKLPDNEPRRRDRRLKELAAVLAANAGGNGDGTDDFADNIDSGGGGDTEYDPNIAGHIRGFFAGYRIDLKIYHE